MLDKHTIVDMIMFCLKWTSHCISGTVVIVWLFVLQLPMRSVPIPTNIVGSNPVQARCAWYNIMW